MDFLNELLGKLPKFVNKSISDQENTGKLQKFGEAHSLKLDIYYELWRSKIRNAARNNDLLSNGWAFSTLGGLSSFERHIRTDQTIRSIYFNKGGEIGLTLDKIADCLAEHDIGGIILYGYGNLFRESYFIEQAKISNLIDTQRVYLVDCSLFYHIFANSPLNPLRNILKDKQIKSLLLDYLDDPSSRDSLVFTRNDLNPTRPALHLFLGNTFGNTEANLLKNTLDTVVHSGDFVIGEYALYPDSFFSDASNDHVSEMVKTATAELFSIPPDTITVRNVNPTTTSKAIEVDFSERNTSESLVFRSMLRRNYSSTELTNGEYQLVSSEPTLQGTVKLDSYRRLSTQSPTNVST